MNDSHSAQSDREKTLAAIRQALPRCCRLDPRPPEKPSPLSPKKLNPMRRR